MKNLTSSSSSTTGYFPAVKTYASKTYKCVNFNDNRYLKYLNHLLTYELGMLELYSGLLGEENTPKFEICLDNHKEVATRLRTLIIENHGIPCTSSTTFTTELSILANQMSRPLGRHLAGRTHLRICKAMESSISRKLKELTEMAPWHDRSELQHLKFLLKANRICLRP
ncbi:MAG: hypothetical protein HRU19_11455 [Pseudobacteriovorax sp.]|nr:hypothetical protein [Pseudobacteriovorax sp.]